MHRHVSIVLGSPVSVVVSQRRLRRRAKAVKEESKRYREEREKAATAWLEARRAEALEKQMVGMERSVGGLTS